ncbi:endonuclease/exonuclease/phosphatase family protein [Methylobacterium sp. NEAU 140]|uniref:endonuclease/exonuclease/phosphatase family protein n=1 Tax=Methylobacterium sp. NEAU 140 TaxID=3064945 RepID=UPI0027360054|nr:endonuclease/exonuclease/phosphatase family protein [Methylobacterium sp. NEAU 140]MDP4023169.1 endonuclease/exonuclease/phosphatase family protein [Methylobacterium sp. NEAU 140]
MESQFDPATGGPSADPASRAAVSPLPIRQADREQSTFKIVSWNLLRRVGAAVDDVAALVEQEKPDLLLMQEATRAIGFLKERIGGHYAWAPLPGRIHGLAMWSPTPFPAHPRTVRLPSGALVHRVCQVLDLGTFGVANVHLSHGQMLNRRQLRRIVAGLPPRAAILGDYNIVGPALVPGFRDVGPRRPTHAMVEVLPLRLDRCLARGLICHESAVLPRGASDHRPIVVHLGPAPDEPKPRRLRDMAAAVARLRRADGWAGGARRDPPPSADAPSSRA